MNGHYVAGLPEQEAANYREVAEILAEAGCDLLLMEMMLDVSHSVRLTEAALATGLPVWIGLSTSRRADGAMVGWDMATEEDGKGLPGDYPRGRTAPLETIIDTLCALGPQVVGIMHSSLDATTAGLDVLFERWDGPVMAYPEAVTPHDGGRLAPEVFAAHCRGWVESGVQIVGGCCGTTIDHIRAMAGAMPERPGSRPPPLRSA